MLPHHIIAGFALLSATIDRTSQCDGGGGESGEMVDFGIWFAAHRLYLSSVVVVDLCLDDSDNHVWNGRQNSVTSSTKPFVSHLNSWTGIPPPPEQDDSGEVLYIIAHFPHQESFSIFAERHLEHTHRVSILLRDSALLNRLTMRLDSLVYLYLPGNAVATIQEVYAPLDGPRILGTLGTWDPASRVYAPLASDSMWERRTDLGGTTFVSADLKWAPLMMGDLKSGFLPDLMNIISFGCNFSIHTVPSIDDKWGSLKSGSDVDFNGVVGMVQRGEAHMSSSGLYAGFSRAEAVDFSVPVLRDTVTLHVQRREGKLVNFNVFMVCFI